MEAKAPRRAGMVDLSLADTAKAVTIAVDSVASGRILWNRYLTPKEGVES
jgi:hypothetical protein